MLNREKLLELFRETLARIKKENRLPLFPVSFRNTYSTVFAGSASKIGSLDACLLSDLVNYYYQVQTLVELAEIFSANLTDICDRNAEQDPDEIAEQIETLEDIIKIASDARESAIKLVNNLDPPPN